MPLQLQSSPSRFCDGKSGFSAMYASMSFDTCVVETFVRDRFTHRLKRELPLAAVLARVSTQPDRELICWICEIPDAWTLARRPMLFARVISGRARRSEKRCMKSTRMWTGSSMRRDSLAMIASLCSIGRWGNLELSMRAN